MSKPCVRGWRWGNWWRRTLVAGNVGDLGWAWHTVADFYAHTLYAQVVAPVSYRLPTVPGNPVESVLRARTTFWK